MLQILDTKFIIMISKFYNGGFQIFLALVKFKSTIIQNDAGDDALQWLQWTPKQKNPAASSVLGHNENLLIVQTRVFWASEKTMTM